MPSARKIMAYRPDDFENALLIKLAKKRGLSMSRLIGTAIREMAERDGVTATDQEVLQVKESRAPYITKNSPTG